MLMNDGMIWRYHGLGIVGVCFVVLKYFILYWAGLLMGGTDGWTQ